MSSRDRYEYIKILKKSKIILKLYKTSVSSSFYIRNFPEDLFLKTPSDGSFFFCYKKFIIKKYYSKMLLLTLFYRTI